MSNTWAYNIDNEYHSVCRFVEHLLFRQSAKSLNKLLRSLQNYRCQPGKIDEVPQFITENLDFSLLREYHLFMQGPEANTFSDNVQFKEIEEHGIKSQETTKGDEWERKDDELVLEKEVLEKSKNNVDEAMNNSSYTFHDSTVKNQCPIEELKNLLLLPTSRFSAKHNTTTSTKCSSDVSKSIQLFQDIYKGMNFNFKNFEILVKYLVLYMEGCFSLPEVLCCIETLPISNTQVLPALKDFLTMREIPRRQGCRLLMPLSQMHNHKKSETSSSYVKIVDAAEQTICLAPSLLSHDIQKELNNQFISKFSFFEDKGFAHPTHNLFQNAMFNIEDEMFELDLVIESAQSLVSRIKKKLQSVEYSSDTFPSQFIEQLPSFNIIHLKVIARLFGLYADIVVDLIFRSSRTTLAVLLKRFEERIQQWEMIREFFITTTWSKNCKKNFYRQFDMKLFTFRFAEKCEVYTTRIMEAHALYIYSLYCENPLPEVVSKIFSELERKISQLPSHAPKTSSMSIPDILSFFYDGDKELLDTLRKNNCQSNSNGEQNEHNLFVKDTVDKEIQKDILYLFDEIMETTREFTTFESCIKQLLINFIIACQKNFPFTETHNKMLRWLETFSHYPSHQQLTIDHKSLHDHIYQCHEDCIKMVLPTEEKDFPTGTTRFSEKTQHKLEDSFIETTLVERDITELIQSIHVSSDTAQLPICVGNITLFALIRLYGMIYLQLTHLKYFIECRRNPNHLDSQKKWDIDDNDPTQRRTYKNFLEHCIRERVMNSDVYTQDLFERDLRVATGNKGYLISLIPLIFASFLDIFQNAIKETKTIQLLVLHSLYTQEIIQSQCCLHILREYLYLATRIIQSNTHFWVFPWQFSPSNIRIWTFEDVPQLVTKIFSNAALICSLCHAKATCTIGDIYSKNSIPLFYSSHVSEYTKSTSLYRLKYFFRITSLF